MFYLSLFVLTPRFIDTGNYFVGDLSLAVTYSTVCQGWAPRSFRFGTFRSFPFLKKNVLFFSVLFSSFWRLMRPKRTFRSFLKNGKERNVLLQRTEKNAKNAAFFCKERKRTQEHFVLLQRNARTFCSCFNIYIDIYRYI